MRGTAEPIIHRAPSLVVHSQVHQRAGTQHQINAPRILEMESMDDVDSTQKNEKIKEIDSKTKPKYQQEEVKKKHGNN
jgi:hypothetical protein